MDTQNLPYPMQFDPSQWSNPYSQWNKKPLDFMGQYAGGSTGPTDAHGNPIQSYQTAAAQKAATPAAAPAVSINSTPQSNIPQYNYNSGGILPSGENYGTSSPTYIPPSYQANPAYALQQQAAAAKQAPAAPAGPDMNAAYMAALQNPGHVTTPGATVPQGPTPSAQSGVLQQFLANWNQKGQPTTGAGNYNNQGFYNALQGQV